MARLEEDRWGIKTSQPLLKRSRGEDGLCALLIW